MYSFDEDKMGDSWCRYCGARAGSNDDEEDELIFDILQNLAATSSRLEKNAILQQHVDNDLLKRVFRMTYHPRIQYWIKKIPPTVELDEEYSLDDALDVLEFELAPRKITGNAAISRLAEVLSKCSAEVKSVLIRVIKRDLEVGCSENTANEIWKDLIPIQPQMLASSCSEKTLKNIKYPAIVQLKADGARCFAEVRGDTRDDVLLLSRGGNEYLDLAKLKDELIEFTREIRLKYPEGVMIDGELVSHATEIKVDPAKNAATAGLDFILGIGNEEHEEAVAEENVVARSKSNGLANKSLKGTITEEEANTMKFLTWDIVPLRCIYGDKPAKSQEYNDRLAELKQTVAGASKIEVIETFIVNNLDEAKEIYKNYVLKGLEGIILKNTDGVWENKRSKNQVKFKEEVDIDLIVVGFTAHKKDPNKLGAISCVSADGLVKVNVGSGFTDTTQVKVKGVWKPVAIEDRGELDREALWLRRDELLNTIVELKCNGWIAKEGRSDYVSLFLPIVQKFRIDKKEANTIYDAFPDCNFQFTQPEEI